MKENLYINNTTKLIEKVLILSNRRKSRKLKT